MGTATSALVLGEVQAQGKKRMAATDWARGSRIERGERLQAVVPADTWQAARPLGGEEALVSCFVSPGFDFADFEAL